MTLHAITEEKPRKTLKSVEIVKKEKKELAKLKQQKEAEEKALQAKIEQNFAKKDEIKNVKKVQTKIKSDEKEVDFFSTLKEEGAKPVSME